VIVKKTYDKGRLISESKLEGGRWKASSFEDLPFFRRLSEEIQLLSQPYKSNYRHFAEQ
jgi:hypothetical protein